ncbi:MAG: hypothetical protein WAS07_13905 [Micropruina sp.]
MSDLVSRALQVALTGREGTEDWDSASVRAHAAEVRASGGIWPHSVPPELRKLVGAARLQAALREAMAELGVTGETVVTGGSRPLNADERRLLADCPPHHLG